MRKTSIETLREANAIYCHNCKQIATLERGKVADQVIENLELLEQASDILECCEEPYYFMVVDGYSPVED